MSLGDIPVYGSLYPRAYEGVSSVKMALLWDRDSDRVAVTLGDLKRLARVEPDYEAANAVHANHRPSVGPVTDRKRVKAIVDAAIGDRLLINPPTEEE